MKFLAGAGALTAVLALIVVLTSASSPPARAAPPLPRAALAGPATDLASLHGKPALIAFFASWCEPCAAEAPTIERAAHALRGHAAFVAVDWSDSRRYALAFVHRFRWSFPVLSDPGGTAGYAYGIQGLPSAFVLDPSGRIVTRLIGPQTAARLLAALRRAGARA